MRPLSASCLALLAALLLSADAPGASWPHETWGGPGARGTGAAASRYATAVTIGDGAGQAGAEGEVAFLAGGKRLATVPFRVAPGGTARVTAPEALEGRGAFLVRVLSSRAVSVWSETWNETPDGRFGLSVPGFTAHETLSAGDVAAFAGGSGKTDALSARSNVGLLCLHGGSCGAEVVVGAEDGTELGRGTLGAEPLSVEQRPLAEVVPASKGLEGLSVRVVATKGRFRPYAVRNDNRTSDGVLVPQAVDRSLGSTFVFPLGCRPGADCWLGNYVDRDPGSRATRDYLGGKLTYDGHVGTDWLVNGFTAMDAGVDVLAAAHGQVLEIGDTNPDRCTSCGGECAPDRANYVGISHPDGTISVYLHLKAGSVLVAAGQTVSRGQKIAEVGSSGCSSDPHLHFHWADPARQAVLDPFTTPDDAYVTPWEEPAPYQGDAGLGVARTVLSRQLVDLASWSLDPPLATDLRRGEKVYLYLYVLRIAEGARYTLQLRDGAGTVVSSESVTSDASTSYYLLALPLSLDGAAGDWDARILEGDTVVKRVRFRVD